MQALQLKQRIISFSHGGRVINELCVRGRTPCSRTVCSRTGSSRTPELETPKWAGKTLPKIEFWAFARSKRFFALDAAVWMHLRSSAQQYVSCHCLYFEF